MGKPVEVVCRVELTKDLEHARLTIPRPAGVEMIPSLLFVPGKAGIAGAEERDDAFHFFIDQWKAGVHEVRFLVRAELTGTVGAPWPEIEPMYADSPTMAIDAATVWRLEAKQP
jgi:hypothetical protein